MMTTHAEAVWALRHGTASRRLPSARANPSGVVQDLPTRVRRGVLASDAGGSTAASAGATGGAGALAQRPQGVDSLRRLRPALPPRRNALGSPSWPTQARRREPPAALGQDSPDARGDGEMRARLRDVSRCAYAAACTRGVAQPGRALVLGTGGSSVRIRPPRFARPATTTAGTRADEGAPGGALIPCGGHRPLRTDGAAFVGWRDPHRRRRPTVLLTDSRKRDLDWIRARDAEPGAHDARCRAPAARGRSAGDAPRVAVLTAVYGNPHADTDADRRCRATGSRQGLGAGRLRRAPRADVRAARATHRAGGLGRPVRVARGRQPSPRRVPLVRCDRRRRLRRRRHSVPDRIRRSRLRDRRGRGRLLGPVPRLLHRAHAPDRHIPPGRTPHVREPRCSRRRDGREEPTAGARCAPDAGRTATGGRTSST